VTKTVQGLDELREEELQIETYNCLCQSKLKWWDSHLAERSN